MLGTPRDRLDTSQHHHHNLLFSEMSSDTEKDIQKEELHADPDLAALVVPLPLPANRPKTVVTSPADLPTELLLNIFKHLPAKDVVSLSLVCRKFYRCSNDSSVWFSLCQTGGGRETVGARDGRRKGGNNSVPRAAKVDWKLEFRWRYGRVSLKRDWKLGNELEFGD